MATHMDYKLKLERNTKHPSLYAWAIQEWDGEKVVGRDLIPWNWSLNFSATSCTLHDSLNIEPKSIFNDEGPPQVSLKQRISVDLKSDNSGRKGSWDETRFSMMGTDRQIKSITLEILPDDSDSQEHCTAWGSVSFEMEGPDFAKFTTDDCIYFYLHMKSKDFERYANGIRDGKIKGVFFRVASVEGFYSDWSPSIETDLVKVLTSDQDQFVDGSLDDDVVIKRLGRVHRASLSIAHQLDIEDANSVVEEFSGTVQLEKESGPISPGPHIKNIEMNLLLLIQSVKVISLLLTILVVISLIRMIT